MKALKNNLQRGKWVVGMFYALIATLLLSLYFKGQQFQLFVAYKAGEVDDALIQADAQREVVLRFAYLGLYIGTASCFLLWFRRAYHNLHGLVHRPAYKEVNATSAWFIPFVNLVRPYQIAHDLYTQTAAWLAERDLSSRLSKDILGLWWTMWLLSAVMGQWLLRQQTSGASYDALLGVARFSLVVNMFDLLLCLVAVKMVNDYRRAERLLWSCAQQNNAEVVASGD